MVQLMKILVGRQHKMCECYDPNSLKYCNIHKEMTNTNNDSRLENILGIVYLKKQENKSQIDY